MTSKNLNLLLAAFGLVLFSGCVKTDFKVKDQEPLPKEPRVREMIGEKPKRGAFERFSQASPDVDIEKYYFDFQMLPDKLALRVHEEITIRLLPAYFRRPKTDVKSDANLRLDAADGLQISSLELVEQAGVSFQHQNGILEIQPSPTEQLPPRLHLILNYDVSASDAFLYFSRAQDNRVFQFATETEPLGSRDWFVSVDRPEDKALFEAVIHTPPEWVALSNGDLVSEVLEEKERITHWHMTAPISSYLFSLVAGEFDRVHQSETPVKNTIWLPRGKEQTPAMLNTFRRMPEMIAYLSEKVFPYPYGKLDLAVVNQYGGMEHTTAITYGQNLIDNYSRSNHAENVVFHELTHQWFGDTVTCATWDDLWLNEGITSFFEILFGRDFNAPDGLQDELAGSQEEYFASEGADYRLGPIVNYTNLPGQKFTSASYAKPALVLFQLMHQMGEAKFMAGLHQYVTDHFMGVATTKSFQRSLEKVYGKSLEEYFDQWIYRKGYPKLYFQMQIDGATTAAKLRIQQTNLKEVGAFHVEVPLRMFMKDKTVKDLNISFYGEPRVISLPDTALLESLVVDPEQTVLMKSTTDFPEVFVRALSLNAEAPAYHRAQAFLRLPEVSISVLQATLTSPTVPKVLGLAIIEKVGQQFAVASSVSDPSADLMFSMIKDTRPWVRGEVALRLGKAQGVFVDKSFAVLKDLALTNEKSSLVLGKALAALTDLEVSAGKDVLPVIQEFSEFHPEREFEGDVVKALIKISDPRGLDLMLRFVESPNTQVQTLVMTSFSSWKSGPAVEYLEKAIEIHLKRPDAFMNYYSIVKVGLKGLAKIHDSAAKDYLVSLQSRTGLPTEVQRAVSELLTSW